MWIVLFVIMLDVIGFGIIGPVLPLYLRNLGVDPIWITITIALYTGALVVATPLLGRLSDRFGRKPIMIYSLIGACIGYIVLAFSDSLLVIALARLFSGFMAGNYGAAQAYMVDISSDQNRARYMGLFGAALGLGFVIGPAIGSLLGGDDASNTNFMLPCLTAAAMCLLAAIAVIFFVRETAPAQAPQTAPASEKKPGFFQSTWLALHKPMLALVILCGTLYHCASGFYEPIFPLWIVDAGIVAGSNQMAPILLVSALCLVLVQAFLIAPLTRRFNERQLIKATSVGAIVMIYLTTLAGDAGSYIGLMVTFSLLYAFAAVILTCAQTLVSRCAEAHERGAIMGLFSSIGTLGRTITTVLSGAIYNYLPFHSPYYAGIVCLLLLWLLSSFIKLPKKSASASGN